MLPQWDLFQLQRGSLTDEKAVVQVGRLTTRLALAKKNNNVKKSVTHWSFKSGGGETLGA
jgi:hypothetical protein